MNKRNAHPVGALAGALVDQLNTSAMKAR